MERDKLDILELLQLCQNHGASDLHIAENMAPRLRVDGDLVPIENHGEMIAENSLLDMLKDLMTKEQVEFFKKNLELDFAIGVAHIGRFRVNIFQQANGVAAAFRAIPAHVHTLKNLGLPDIFERIASYPRGLVLVTGPTGSGKSTTLAAMVDYINQHKPLHILTIEDPIEYLHESKASMIEQREVGRDTQSFNAALRSALREDPDVILVGELRDLETIRLALTAAETGHLVFATLHTSSAANTINRIIDVFPAGEKNLVRNMLAESLQAVIAQTLLKRTGGGRVAALEVLLCNAAVRNLIREDKVPQIYSVMQTNASLGMQTLDQYLKTLVANQTILRETAREVAFNKELV